MIPIHLKVNLLHCSISTQLHSRYCWLKWDIKLSEKMWFFEFKVYWGDNGSLSCFISVLFGVIFSVTGVSFFLGDFDAIISLVPYFERDKVDRILSDVSPFYIGGFALSNQCWPEEFLSWAFFSKLFDNLCCIVFFCFFSQLWGLLMHDSLYIH